MDPGDLDAVGRRGIALMVAAAEETLRRYDVVFDIWSSERALHESGAVERALDEAREAGHVYESEGATWLRTTSFGDDKDRVLIRSDGESTYFLSDIAYHREKLDRGSDRLIDVLGADHHGYVERLRAGLAALGYEPAALEVAIMQLVHVVEGGERAQMSKRSGDFVTLDELIDDIGVDAARFFMLQRSHDTTVDLDLELARKTSNENPVYYVQYAHARIASILRKAEEETGESAEQRASDDFAALPVEPTERALIKRLCELPDEVAETAAAARAPPALRLRDGGGARLPCLLPGLSGRRGVGRGRRGGAARPLPAHQADDCEDPGAAWDLGAGADVAARRPSCGPRAGRSGRPSSGRATSTSWQIRVVHLHHLGERDAPRARDLPGAGEPGAHLVSQAGRDDQRVLLGRERPGADQAHGSRENLEELRELVERGRPDVTAKTSQAGVILDLEEPVGGLTEVPKVIPLAIRVHDHRPELEHHERLTIPSDPSRAEEDRPGGVELDQDRDHEHHRSQQDDRDQRDDDVDGPLQESREARRGRDRRRLG